MGYTKRMMEEEEQRRGIALGIAIEAGVISRCEFHEDCTFDGGADVEDAYRLGNSKYSRGELGDYFKNRRHLTDTIKDVVEDNNGVDECQICARIRDED